MNLPPRYMSADFAWREFVSNLTSSRSVIIQPNQDRVMIMFGLASSPITMPSVSTNGNLASQLGFNLTVNSQPLTFTFRDHGPMVGSIWYGISPAGNVSITVAELVYQPMVNHGTQNKNESGIRRSDDKQRPSRRLFARPYGSDNDVFGCS